MGGPPPAPAVIAPPPAPVAEVDPAVEAAKEKETTRLATRKSFKSTIRTKSTQAGELEGESAELLKTTLGSA
jgi:hypothetical protein